MSDVGEENGKRAAGVPEFGSDDEGAGQGFQVGPDNGRGLVTVLRLALAALLLPWLLVIYLALTD